MLAAKKLLDEMESDESPLRKFIDDYMTHRNALVYQYHHGQANVTQIAFSHAMAAWGHKFKQYYSNLTPEDVSALEDVGHLYPEIPFWEALVELVCLAYT